MNRTNTTGASWRYGILLSLLLSGCGSSASDNAAPEPPQDPPAIGYVYAPPADIGDGWTTARADELGIDIAGLESAMHAIAAGEFEYIDSLAVAHSGVLVLDETLRQSTGFEDTRVDNIDPTIHRQFSVSKSITSLLVGIAIEDGYIAGVDTPFLDLFAYPAYANWDVRKGDITLADVLAMQSGLEWNEWDPPYTSSENRLNRFIETETDYAKAVLDLPLIAEPGTAFAYNTALSVALGQAIENALPMAIIDYGLDVLFKPLGITDIEVLTTPTGLPNGGSGFYLRTRDAAKFAQLLLDGGRFNGNAIVSEGWISESVTARTAVAWDDPEDWAWQVSGYGYQWWTGRYNFGGRELETWVAWGFGSQWVIAIPELSLAIAINSDGYSAGDVALKQAHVLVRDYLLPAMPGVE